MVISRRRFAENEKYMHKNKKKARELNMQILWSCLLPLRRRSVARVPNTTARDQYMAKLKMA